MNRSPTIAAARFSSLLPAPIHPMQARLLALVAAHRFATTTQLARLTAPEYASSARPCARRSATWPAWPSSAS